MAFKGSRNFKHFLPLLAIVALSACKQKVELKDGMIPDELMPYAQDLVGEFRGQMNRHANTLTFRLDGNKMVITAAEDLIGNYCESVIGDVKSITYKEKDGKITLTSARVKFDPALCSDHIEGRELFLDFGKESPISFDVTLLDHYEQYVRCYSNPYPGYGPGPVYPGYPGYPGYSPYPGTNCHWESVPYYSSGHFVKN